MTLNAFLFLSVQVACTGLFFFICVLFWDFSVLSSLFPNFFPSIISFHINFLSSSCSVILSAHTHLLFFLPTPMFCYPFCQYPCSVILSAHTHVLLSFLPTDIFYYPFCTHPCSIILSAHTHVILSAHTHVLLSFLPTPRFNFFLQIRYCCFLPASPTPNRVLSLH